MSSDSTLSYSAAQNDFTATEHLWRRAFKEIQPLASALAAQNDNEPLANAYAQAVKQTRGNPQTWEKTGWNQTLTQILGKYIELTTIDDWDWPLALSRPANFKPLQTIAWSSHSNPQEILHLIWVKNTCLLAVTDDLTLLKGAILNYTRLTFPPNKNNDNLLTLKLWVWDKKNFTPPNR
jgi:hypothetical protein